MSLMEELDRGQDAYTSSFKFYDENLWMLTQYAERICNVLRKSETRSLLSLGIGYRTVSEKIIGELEHSLERYDIVEGSGKIIEEFQRALSPPPQVRVTHSLFEDYDAPEAFEAIEIGFVLEHVDDPGLILKKFTRFLKPGGVMFISVPNARSLHRLIGHEAGLLEDMYRLSEEDLQLGHQRYFDLESLRKTVLDAGLTITHTQGLMLKPITTGQMAELGWGDNIVQALMKLGDRYAEISNSILIEATR